MLKIIEFQDGNKLHITDDPIILDRLLNDNLFAIPAYNDKNINLNWPHTDYAVSNIEELLEINPSKDYFKEGIDFIPDYLIKVYQRLNNIPWLILETKRTVIREMTVEDVPEFYRIYSCKDITKYMDNLFENIEDEIIYTKNYIKNIYGFYGYGLWTVVDKETGHVIGRAGLSNVEGYPYPDLGFVIDKEYQKCGIATEVCNAIIDYAKNELEFDTIEARVQPDNIISQNLLKKLGFSISCKPHQGYLEAHRKLS